MTLKVSELRRTLGLLKDSDALLNSVAQVLAVAWSLEQIYVACIAVTPTMIARPLHLAFALAITAAAGRGQRKKDSVWRPLQLAQRWGLIILPLLVGLYYIHVDARLEQRIAYVDPLTEADVVVGIVVLVLVINATRRLAGWALTTITLCFVAYDFLGPALPGLLHHSGISVRDFLDLQTMSTQGIFGVPLGVSADYVFYFILIAAFLELSGGGKVFIDLALTAVGRYRGGGAKAGIVASSLFGMITGSAVANVSAVGMFTIPLMKRVGYSPVFSGAVEALASTGGQIMPPVMGAGAFIMAQMVGVPYADIAFAAAIPAILYYLSAYFMVDLQARREGITPLPRSLCPPFAQSLRSGYLLLPLVYLIYAIVNSDSLVDAAVRCIGLIIAVSFVRRSSWMTPGKILSALAIGGRNAISVAIPCAAAGIIVGVTVQSGLGLKFSSLIVAMAGHNLYVGLVLVMLGCIIMGMGLPTTAAYILAAVLMVPALVQLGANELAANLFVFYFACVSMITPPVALAAYAAASISGASLSATGWTAARIGLSAYLVPFAFVLGPSLVLQGPWYSTVSTAATAALGVYALSGAVIGFLRSENRVWETVLLGAAAIALITPVLKISAVGLVLLVAVLVSQRSRVASPRRLPQAAVPTDLSEERSR